VSKVVIDASVVLRWAFEDEPDRAGAVHVAQALADNLLDVVGPPNFLLEVASVLLLALRSGRIDRETADLTLEGLSRVAIPEQDAHAFASASYRLALATGIRVPDAAYVESARNSSAALISADHAQLRAAADRGVPAIPLSSVHARLS
jgi:predicted nucleic acid-binding protein